VELAESPGQGNQLNDQPSNHLSIPLGRNLSSCLIFHLSSCQITWKIGWKINDLVELVATTQGRFQR